MRKYLSHAFSQQSLNEQEFLISQSTDKFVEKLGEAGTQGIDIVLYFTLMSFDIIGDLGFGESFGGIESSERETPVVHLLTWNSPTLQETFTHGFIE